MQSIRQNDLPDALPNFRNLGVMSRILLSVNALALLFAVSDSLSFLWTLTAWRAQQPVASSGPA